MEFNMQKSWSALLYTWNYNIDDQLYLIIDYTQ